MDPHWAGVVTAIATGFGAAAAAVAAVAAIRIPIAIEKAAHTTRSFQAMNHSARVIDRAVANKQSIDARNHKSVPEMFSFDYIKNNDDVRTEVYTILNEYEYLCLAANLGVFEDGVLMGLRGDALKQTYKDYDDFITRHRASAPQNAKAWQACPRFIRRVTGK
jgi:hypothetical protein